MSARAPRSRNKRGRGFPGCGRGSDRAHFDMAEAERAQRVEVITVLVETRGQADGMRKSTAQQLDVEPGPLWHPPAAPQQLEAAQCQVMSGLGRQPLEHRKA